MCDRACENLGLGLVPRVPRPPAPVTIPNGAINPAVRSIDVRIVIIRGIDLPAAPAARVHRTALRIIGRVPSARGFLDRTSPIDRWSQGSERSERHRFGSHRHHRSRAKTGRRYGDRELQHWLLLEE